MRRKKERSKQGQTNKQTKQHSTPKAVTFPRKNELPRVGLEPTTLYTLDRALSWLGPNLTSHSTPDEQANHQLSMKEKAGVMKPPMTPNTKPSIYMFLNERSKQDQTNKAKQHSTPNMYMYMYDAMSLGMQQLFD